MDSQLIQALIERIKAGHTKSQIREEMMAIGYDENAFEAAYSTASADGEESAQVPPTPAIVASTLPPYLTLAKDGLKLALAQIPLLLKTILAFVVICLSAALLIQMSGSFLVSGPESIWAVMGLISFIIFVSLIALIGIISVFANILRILLKRKESVRYRDGLFWSGTHVVASITSECLCPSADASWICTFYYSRTALEYLPTILNVFDGVRKRKGNCCFDRQYSFGIWPVLASVYAHSF